MARAAGWPRSEEFASRFYVADLDPLAEGALKHAPRAVFVGESPHRDEVAPEDPRERTPFRGMAGREWWAALSRHLPQDFEVPSFKPMPPRAKLLEICSRLGVGLMNAVNYPIDPKIELHYGAPSNPFKSLGFEKGSGPTSYKSVFKASGVGNPVEAAISSLRSRLGPWLRAGVPVVCLGGDSRWFTEKALGSEASILTLPHPASWWRNQEYRARALAGLDELLGNRSVAARGVTRRGAGATPGR